MSSLLFVYPTQNFSRREKEQQDSKIRAHVTRLYHKQNRQRREKRRAVFEKESASLPPSKNQQDEVLYDEVAVQKHLQTFIHTDLLQNRRDPFDTLGNLGCPDYVHVVLDFANKYTWRNVTHSQSPQNQVQQAILNNAISHPAILHSTIFANILHLKVHQLYPDEKRMNILSLRHQIETTRLINEEIQTQVVPSDAILYSVCSLAVHGRESETDDSLVPYPPSPLRTAQNLHIYGHMKIEKTHMEGMYTLVRAAGGFDHIQTKGVAYAVQMADLYFAMRMKHCPRFIWRLPGQSLSEDVNYVMDLEACKLLEIMGKGFVGISGLTACHYEVIQMFADSTVGLDHFHRRDANAPTFLTIVNARGAAQHKLLSLPIHERTKSRQDLNCEMIRQSLLIYSDMALYCLPPESGVRVRLAESLLACLKEVAPQMWESETLFLTWAVVLGGIAANGSVHRKHYLRIFCDEIIPRLDSCLLSLSTSMRLFLWWEPVCGSPAELFKNEALDLSNA